MKRIITYLIVLLLSFPLMGQITQDRKKEHKAYNNQRTIKVFKKDIKEVKRSHYQVHTQRKEILKYTKADMHSLDSLVYQTWDDNLGAWVKTLKEEFTYNTNNYVNTMVNYTWNSYTSKWYPDTKNDYVFDMNGNLTSLISYEWDIDDWSWQSKNEYTYDGNGNLTLETFYVWTNSWFKLGQVEYVYDLSGRLTEMTGQSNLWGTWKDTFTYDVSGNLDFEIYYFWNGSNWDQMEKWDYTYDAGNNLMSEINSNWMGDINSGEWVNAKKYDYTYLAGNMTTEIGWLWNSGWVEDYKDVYTFDANGNLTLGIYYYWYSNDWIPYEKEEFIYDLSYNSSDLIIPYIYMIYDYPNMLIGYRRYEFTDPTWKEVDKMILFFSDYNNALNIHDEILSRSVKLYPNPVHDVLSIHSEIPLSKVEVFSILGKKVKEFNAGFNSMRIDNLSNGVYIVRILAEKGSATRKLIKK